MAQDSFKYLILLTILVGLTLSNGEPFSYIKLIRPDIILTFVFVEHQHYFYSLDGEQVSPNVNLRLKRDTQETTKAPSVKPVTPTTSVETTKATDASTSSSTEKSSQNPETADKSRGWLNETTVLENVDVNDNTFNASIESHLKDDNLTVDSATDHFKYYNSTYVTFEDNWIDLDEWNRTTHPGIVNQHSMLSKSYRYLKESSIGNMISKNNFISRRAATIALKFKFPFYGHYVKNITIATGGFLYTGEYVHSWLAATQYIAPLMANFDTSQMENATVKYADNGTTLVVEWANVFLQGSDGGQLEGPFTFQAILHKKGDIIFAYKSIPISISTITDDDHPVKVGLSDAYIIERTIFCKLKFNYKPSNGNIYFLFYFSRQKEDHLRISSGEHEKSSTLQDCQSNCDISASLASLQHQEDM